jgi:hypothetical protein
MVTFLFYEEIQSFEKNETNKLNSLNEVWKEISSWIAATTMSTSEGIVHQWVSWEIGSIGISSTEHVWVLKCAGSERRISANGADPAWHRHSRSGKNIHNFIRFCSNLKS